MFSKTFSKTIVVRQAILTVVLGCAALLGQQTPSQQTPSQQTPAQHAPAASSFSGALEFPVVMRQNVAAGTTPVGTKVQAKLAVATLVDGVVVPRDAVFSGEVTESVAKSVTDPSRLAIRMDSAQWKKGIGTFRAYARVEGLLDRVVLPRGGDEGSGSLRRITERPTKLETTESPAYLPRSKRISLGAISRPWRGHGPGLLAALAIVKYFEAPRFDEKCGAYAH
jgi:hypothetical protein